MFYHLKTTSVANLAWGIKCGTVVQFVVYGRTVFVLSVIAQEDVLSICV
jgi:hypothetical protein